MARIAQCPSCGAEITFRSVVSVLAVCEYCRTTLFDKNGEIENLGKMAALVEDHSPLRLGSEGKWARTHFTVIGRLQLKYEQGAWSEWFLLFDNHRTGWLSEASGEYALFFPQRAESLPAFSTLKPGDAVVLEYDGATTKSKSTRDEWIVTDIERAECVSGEGELPFKVGSGYPAPVVDLRAGSRIATLDYSESEDHPQLFVGETVEFSHLAWANLREGTELSAKRTTAQALRCAQCGAPLAMSREGILAIGCGVCGAITDTKKHNLLSALKGTRMVAPLIPLGTVGTFRGEKLEVIGFMQRGMLANGIKYLWREYLLARVNKPGYRWLTEYDGHWNVVDVISDSPAPFGESNQLYSNTAFKRFQEYTAWVDFVIGEFSWKVKVQEQAHLIDYVAPPWMLSKESTESEVTWSLSEYVEPREITLAFGSTLPDPVGVYANQPSPWKARNKAVWPIALFFISLAWLLQFIFSAQSWEFLQDKALIGMEPWISEPFTLKHSTTLQVVSETKDSQEPRFGNPYAFLSKPKDSWAELKLWLVNEQGGESRAESADWVENKQQQTLVFRRVPAGRWRLMVEFSPDSNNPAFLQRSPWGHDLHEVSVTVSQPPAQWSNLWILMFVLLIWPLYVYWQKISFETNRWAESDEG